MRAIVAAAAWSPRSKGVIWPAWRMVRRRENEVKRSGCAGAARGSDARTFRCDSELNVRSIRLTEDGNSGVIGESLGESFAALLQIASNKKQLPFVIIRCRFIMV